MWAVAPGSVRSGGVLHGREWLISLSPTTSCEKLGVSGSSAYEVEALNKNPFGPMLGRVVEVKVDILEVTCTTLDVVLNF